MNPRDQSAFPTPVGPNTYKGLTKLEYIVIGIHTQLVSQVASKTMTSAQAADLAIQHAKALWQRIQQEPTDSG
jgi:hypothetical protein